MTEKELINRAENESNDEVFDTTGLVLDYFAHWKWFVVSVVLCLIGAWFYIHSVMPVYEANAAIYLDPNTEKNAIAFDPANPLLAMKDYIDQTEIEILKSRNNMVKVVDSLGLAYSYKAEGTLRDIQLYENNPVAAELDSVSLAHLKSPIYIKVENTDDSTRYNIDARTTYEDAEEHREFENVELPFSFELSQGTVTLTRQEHVPAIETAEKITILNPQSVAAGLSGAMNLSMREDAWGIVFISYANTAPALAVDVISTMIEFYNRKIVENKNLSAIQTEAFILDRLVMINDELRDVEQRLQEYRQAHNISNLDQQVSSSIHTRSTTESQLAEVEAQQQLLSSIEAQVAKSSAFSPIPSVSSDNALNQVIEAYNKKVSQYNRMLETSTPDNPVARRLAEDITRDKSRILQNISSVKNGINARRNNIREIENRSQGQLAALPPVDKGLQEIFREQQVKVNIYTFLLQKREEIALQKTMATPTAQLIDDPSVSGAPVRPKRAMSYSIGLLLGLLIPALIIFIRRYLFPRFKDQEELQRLTDVPVLGEISKNPAGAESNSIVIDTEVATPIAELLRLLRNNIGFTKNGATNKVILVTSAVSGEGKTFIASNLAMTYALSGKRTIVVGLDIRRPMLAHALGFDNRRGVTTYLSGQCDNVDDLILQSKENANLYLLPAGPVPPNPNELLLSPRMTTLMQKLRDEFDCVILDTAPIGVISDSYIIVPHSDIQLYVTRASFSSQSSLKVLHQAIRQGRMPNVYIVLNGVNISSASYTYRKYGHYYRAGLSTYGYGYGYSERNNSNKKK